MTHWRIKHWLFSLLPIETQRKRLLARCPEGPLKEYLSEPFVDVNTKVKNAQILSVDFETTGLNAKYDKLLSIGFVGLNGGKVNLGSSYHQIIKSDCQLQKQNVAIHQITDFEKDRGAELKLALDTLLRAMTGKVLLVHFAKIERNFIQRACLEIYGIVPPLQILDTLKICKLRLDKSDTAYDPSNLRLVNLRKSFALPSFHAHNALNDAIATAELFLAELYHHHKGIDTKLKTLF